MSREEAADSSATASPSVGCVENAANCQVVMLSGATKSGRVASPVPASVSTSTQTHVSGKKERTRVIAVRPSPLLPAFDDPPGITAGASITMASSIANMTSPPRGIIPPPFVVHFDVFIFVTMAIVFESMSAGG